MADEKADVRHIQQMLRDAGYDVRVDGVDGPNTREALRQYNTSQSTVNAERAKADTAKANAEAEAAKATAEATRATAETARIKADEQKRADDAAAENSKRVFDTAVTGSAYVAGVVAGTKTAKAIDAKVAEGLANKNRELKKVAKNISPLIDAVDAAGSSKKNASLVQRALTKVGAAVATADKIGLTQVGRGPAGPVAAVGALAIGAASRYAGTQTDNETVKTVLNATGTAEMVAGAVIGVKDLANRAAPTTTVDAKALTTIEQGRALVAEAAAASPAAAKAPSLAARVLGTVSKVAGKVALPVAAAVVTVEAVRGYKEDGMRGAVRNGVNALDPSALVMPEGKGLVERLFDRFAGSARRDAAGVSSSRVAAGREAAARERTLENTPVAQSPPAVTANKAPMHQAADSVAHINHGWTNAARAASQKARGVNVTISGK